MPVARGSCAARASATVRESEQLCPVTPLMFPRENPAIGCVRAANLAPACPGLGRFARRNDFPRSALAGAPAWPPGGGRTSVGEGWVGKTAKLERMRLTPRGLAAAGGWPLGRGGRPTRSRAVPNGERGCGCPVPPADEWAAPPTQPASVRLPKKARLVGPGRALGPRLGARPTDPLVPQLAHLACAPRRVCAPVGRVHRLGGCASMCPFPRFGPAAVVTCSPARASFPRARTPVT